MPTPPTPRDFARRLETTCADGTVLSVGVVEPVGPARGLVLAGHAMMVDGRSLDRPLGAGFASTLAQHGLRVLVADLRGHGRSGTPAAQGGNWSYDDLVAQDLPALYQLARAEADGLPLVIAGQSLMGHVALAWLGQHPDAEVAAVVLLSANVWLAGSEPRLSNRLRRWRDLAVADLAMALVGYLPARRLGMGPVDEARPYFRQLARFCRSGRWVSADGIDYHAGLGRLRVPVLAVVGKGDRYWCNLDTSRYFLAPLPAPLCTLWHVGRGDHGLGDDPGHMELVTDPRSAPLWRDIATWVLAQLPA